MTRLLKQLQRRRSLLASLFLVTYLPACTTWHVGTPTPAEFIAREQPERVRVTRLDGTTVDLRAPEIRGDSVWGSHGGGLAQGDSAARVGLPLSDVRQVAVRRASAGKTLLLIGGTVATLFIAAAIACSGSSDEFYSGC
jgi:hypothetical protein